MSAFVVGDKHVDFMLSAAIEYGRQDGGMRWMDPGEFEATDHEPGQPWGSTAVANAQTRLRSLTRENASNVGRMLLLANARSVAFRYNEPFDLPLYDFTAYNFGPAHYPNAAAVLKAVACFRYQSCERPDWERSEAAAFCEALERQAINALPGYSSADWEVTA